MLVKSIFDLVSLRMLSTRMREYANDDTTIAGVGHTLRLCQLKQFPTALKYHQWLQGDDNVTQVA